MRPKVAVLVLLLSMALTTTACEQAVPSAGDAAPSAEQAPRLTGDAAPSVTRAVPAAVSASPCAGDAQDAGRLHEATEHYPSESDWYRDAERVREAMAAGRQEEMDAILACGASKAAETPGYRWVLAHLLHTHHEVLAHLQGYQEWARSTVLRFKQPVVRLLPQEWREEGYTIESALPSPDGEYMAARLRAGGGSRYMAWWKILGGDKGLYPDAGYDLAWQRAWPRHRFAYLTPGHMNIVTVGPEPGREVVPVPGDRELRHTHWRDGTLFYRHSGSDHAVMAIADPTGSPAGVAYVLRLGLLDDFNVNMTPFAWLKQTIPDWLAQPWHPHNGLLLTVHDGVVVYPNPGGSPAMPFRVPAGAEPVAQVWSPRGKRFAVIVKDSGGTSVHIISPVQNPRDPHPVHPITAEHIAVADDGATLFMAEGSRLTARNFMAGIEEQWQLDGQVVELRHERGAVYVILPDRVVVVAYA